MDLNTVTEIAHPQNREQLPLWAAGDAWLAGGTWLFSEPQVHLGRLIDLADLGWPALSLDDTRLTIAATCTIAQLDGLVCPPEWAAAPLINQCCRAFLASFKIWKTATVGGNLCMSLPAGPMISLTAALDGVCTIWKADGSEQKIDVVDFVTGNQRNVLASGDLLRQIEIPLAAPETVLRISPDFIDPGRPVRGAADRQHRQRWRAGTDGDGLHQATRSTGFCGNPRGGRGARHDPAAHSRHALSRRHPRQTGMAQAYDAAVGRGNSRRTSGRGPAMTYQINGKAISENAASRAMPADLPAPAR